jgi:hypothetical protein
MRLNGFGDGYGSDIMFDQEMAGRKSKSDRWKKALMEGGLFLV